MSGSVDNSEKVRFIFFEGISWSSKLIRWFTRSKFSHVGLYIKDNTLWEVYHIDPIEPWCLEWIENSIFLHSKGTKFVILELCVTIEQKDVIFRFIKNLVNSRTPYDWGAIFKFIFKAKPKQNNKYFCSEGCMSALKKAFPNRFNDINPATISPQIFYVILKAMGAKIFKKGVI